MADRVAITAMEDLVACTASIQERDLFTLRPHVSLPPRDNASEVV